MKLHKMLVLSLVYVTGSLRSKDHPAVAMVSSKYNKRIIAGPMSCRNFNVGLCLQKENFAS